MSHVDILRVEVTHVHPQSFLHNTQNITHMNKNSGRPAVSFKHHGEDFFNFYTFYLTFFIKVSINDSSRNLFQMIIFKNIKVKTIVTESNFMIFLNKTAFVLFYSYANNNYVQNVFYMIIIARLVSDISLTTSR